MLLEKQDGVVEPAGGDRPGDQHEEGSAGEQQALWSGWRDERHGREDDVRPKAKGQFDVNTFATWRLYLLDDESPAIFVTVQK